ncbi:structural maintenance of chromosomes protein 1A-like isoform X2 [Periplaneta americana]|uniref:structural maintenance of chromosomes protein 1A-like isoform X2 n=1 Tax=Periplaneta americana TaxID=6978 RepID=UPI0037E94D5F
MLSYIKLYNFKTYKEEVVVGPLRKQIFVTGPTDSGKSNLLDAIVFVLGVNLDLLRVNNYTELIHGGNYNRPISDSASVTAVLHLDDGTEKEFTRSILLQNDTTALTHYFINNENVDKEIYLAELEELQLPINSVELIFHRNMQTFVTMKSKNFTALIEDISGSGYFKKEYDVLQERVQKSELKIVELNRRKRYLTAERNVKKKESSELEEYNCLKTLLNGYQLREKMILLYQNQEKCKALEERHNHFKGTVSTLSKKKAQIENKLKDINLEMLKLRISETAKELQKAEIQYQEKCELLRTKERDVQHLASKMKSTAHLLETRKSLNFKCSLAKEKLEKDLQDLREMETLIDIDLSKKGVGTFLDEDLMKEYTLLKLEAVKQTKGFREELRKIEKKKDGLQENLDRQLLEAKEISCKQNGVKIMMDALNKRSEENHICIKKEEDILQKKKEFQAEIKANTEKMDKVKRDLEAVTKKLEDMKIINEVYLKEMQKQDIVKNLKYFLGENVFGRLSDFCRPVHHGYKLAITKALGNNANTLIVKNKTTALEVVEYFKTNLLPPETILTLEDMKVHPMEEELRGLNAEVKLLSDVVECPEPLVMPVVQSVLSDCLVCEDLDTAMHVAYTLDAPKTYNVVTLNGTYCHKNGVVSSGVVSEQRNARCSMEDIFIVNNRKTELRKNLQDLEKSSTIIPSLEQHSDEIQHLELRVRNAKEDQKKTVDRISELESELQNLNSKSENTAHSVNQLQEEILNCNKNIQKLEEMIQTVEDEIFAEFCHKTDVENIRECEGISFRLLQEKTEKLQELSMEIDKTLNQLEFEKDRMTPKNILKRMKEELKNLEALLETAKAKVLDTKEELEIYRNNLNEVKLELKRFKSQQFMEEKQVAMMKDDIQTISEDIRKGNFNKTDSKMEIERLKSQFQILLLQCKCEGIDLPMKQQTMEEFRESESSDNAPTPPVNAEIDFDLLPEKLRDINNVEENLRKLKSLAQKTMIQMEDLKPNAEELYDNDNGEAMMILENEDEPYLDGVKYSVKVPGKLCVVMDCLPPEEATMASLAFLFALNRYVKSPFIILDEPDALLDKKSLFRLTDFLKKNNDLQTIIIPHHPIAYAIVADDVIGVLKEEVSGKPIVSKLSLLGLAEYQMPTTFPDDSFWHL